LLFDSDEQFGKRPLHVRKSSSASVEENIDAEMRFPRQTVVALEAGSRWIDSHTLADAELCNIFSHIDDLAGDLVTERQRLANSKIAGRSIVIIVQIGTTNSTGPESHEDFTLTRLGVWTLFESEVFGSMDNAGDHDDLSPVGTERTRDPSNRPCTHTVASLDSASGLRKAREILFQAIANGSVVSWQHINLLDEYDFSDEKLQDSVGIKPPKLAA
jgi:hypothetical protein